MTEDANARCSGCVTKTRQRPLPCCVLCARRLPPKPAEVVTWHEFIPSFEAGKWVCSGRKSYGDE